MVACCQLFFSFLFLFLALPRRTTRPHQPANVPLSVLICAHNEADYLSRFLPEVLAQDYFSSDGVPAFEVIVVNDASNDASAGILTALAQEHQHLRIVTIADDEARTFPGKKFPLSKALDAARHELVVCTDADCRPAGRYWLQALAAPLVAGKEIVAGYGGFFKEKGWLNAFIQHETLNTFMQYSAYCRAGLPYMAVGRNLAARKAAFLEAQQSPAWSALPSGDDDLLVQAVATAHNMAIVDQPETFCFSEPKKNLKEYLAQKRRHLSTAKYYSWRSKILPGLFALTHAAWWLLLLLACLFSMPWPCWLLLFLPMLLLCFMQQTISRRMQTRTTIPGWLLFSLGWLLYNALLAPYMLWKTKQRWT